MLIPNNAFSSSGPTDAEVTAAIIKALREAAIYRELLASIWKPKARISYHFDISAIYISPTSRSPLHIFVQALVISLVCHAKQ